MPYDLIGKYQRMPEGESKHLLRQLPPHWQEALVANYTRNGALVRVSFVFDNHEFLPANIELRRVQMKIEQVLKEEIDRKSDRRRQETVDHLHRAWNHMTGTSNR